MCIFIAAMAETYFRHMKTARTRPEAARMLKSQAVRRKKSVRIDRRVCKIIIIIISTMTITIIVLKSHPVLG